MTTWLKLHSRGKNPNNSLDWRLGGPQCRPDAAGEEEIFCLRPESNTVVYPVWWPSLNLSQLSLTFHIKHGFRILMRSESEPWGSTRGLKHVRVAPEAALNNFSISELRPPTDLLFFPKVIYEYGEPRWNDTDRGKPKNSEKTLSQCHFVCHVPHGRGERPATDCLEPRHWKKEHKRIANAYSNSFSWELFPIFLDTPVWPCLSPLS
jgi:hypothetical protein